MNRVVGGPVFFAVGALFLLGGCAPTASSGGTSASGPPGPDLAGANTTPATPNSPAAGGATGEGLYTSEQADRGERLFGDVCAACHGLREFQGRMFQLTWMAEPVGALYQHISTSMPQDDPGSLRPAEYAAIVAYILRLNGLPPGSHEIPTDTATLATYRWTE